ncbi:unnamed protein product [Haemonchus placei]|uniref:Uncharacterized protein n=1 Tax=Haemonchus placei TaxID=6290 RepID=A0A3P7Z2J3_HAEPC|nr:unnamed protein product [Haemonchus placei]
MSQLVHPETRFTLGYQIFVALLSIIWGIKNK